MSLSSVSCVVCSTAVFTGVDSFSEVTSRVGLVIIGVLVNLCRMLVAFWLMGAFEGSFGEVMLCRL